MSEAAVQYPSEKNRGLLRDAGFSDEAIAWIGICIQILLDSKKKSALDRKKLIGKLAALLDILDSPAPADRRQAARHLCKAQAVLAYLRDSELFNSVAAGHVGYLKAANGDVGKLVSALRGVHRELEQDLGYRTSAATMRNMLTVLLGSFGIKESVSARLDETGCSQLVLAVKIAEEEGKNITISFEKAKLITRELMRKVNLHKTSY